MTTVTKDQVVNYSVDSDGDSLLRALLDAAYKDIQPSLTTEQRAKAAEIGAARNLADQP